MQATEAWHLHLNKGEPHLRSSLQLNDDKGERERKRGGGGRECWAIEAAIAIGIGIESALFGNSTSGPCSGGVVKRWRGWGWVVGRGGGGRGRE